MEHLIFYWTPLHINQYIYYCFHLFKFSSCVYSKTLALMFTKSFSLYVLGKFLNRNLWSLFGRHGAQTSNAQFYMRSRLTPVAAVVILYMKWSLVDWASIAFIIYIFPKKAPRKKFFKRNKFSQMALLPASRTKLIYFSSLRKKKFWEVFHENVNNKGNTQLTKVHFAYNKE